MSRTVDTANELRRQFNAILDRLLIATEASRTTLRMDLPALSFHVDDPAGEALLPGTRSLTGQTALDQRSLATVRWLAEHQSYLVQERCRGADPAPPQALMELYGVQAQMLGPVIRSGDMVGWISVHENRTTRKWSEEDIRALEKAVAEVQAVIDRIENTTDAREGSG